ncbi:MAG: AFG1 family ATPase [Xanthomonadales bacterium]|nr:AFG1 family ATPase [Xanthomonadales bacterium]
MPEAPTAAPSAAWQAGVEAGRWQDDPAQRRVLPYLDRLHGQLLAPARTGLLARLRPGATVPAPRGLYLWGGVGRGKTFLVDLLAGQLPTGTVQRRHFHRFMGEVHQALRELRLSGVADPLPRFAQSLRRQCRLLCLDEFLVHDIGDAMLMAGLLRGLHGAGVVLATTSNTAPADLYRDGLQRNRFLPAIAHLETQCEVVELVSDTDHRLRSLRQAPVYLVEPDSARADAALAARFQSLAPGPVQHDGALEVEGRAIPARALADGVAWFDFAVLCQGPRAVADYLELARSFNTVLIGGVPALGPAHLDDAAKRMIHLVDAFYDHKVKLLVAAAAPAEALYPDGRLAGQFQRTASRLIEMQDVAYLALEHQP